MKPALPEVYEECRAHFNEPVLAHLEVVRLIGYAEDEDDVYYVIQYPNPRASIAWHTAVGGIYFLDRLKGQGYVKSVGGEDWDDLYRVDNVLALNGAPKAEKFVEVFWTHTPAGT